jgi:adenylate cyclase
VKLLRTNRRVRRPWVSGSLAGAFTGLAGLVLLLFPAGGVLERLSYDLPFVLRGKVAADEIALVYLDETSHMELKQPMTAPWDRSLHAQLVRRLTADGAKLIVFDILFTEASSNPAADAEFAEAIQRSGRVILAGNFIRRETTSGATNRWEEIPYEPFRVAAVGWGNANLLSDPDYGVRRFFPNLDNLSGQTNIAWLPWSVASHAGGTEPQAPPQSPGERWLNYYGPPGTIPGVSYFLALLPEGVPRGFFKDKIVFVGAQLSADFSGKGKDEFRTPYAYWGSRGYVPGAEIHATATLNLMQRRWLERLGWPFELVLVLGTALLAGIGLMRSHPLVAVLLALAATLVCGLAACLLAWRAGLWFAWAVIVLEIGIALFWSLLANSLRLYVEKRLLEESLEAHLSPKIVKRLLNDPTLRRPGGSVQEVSLLFSDVANFTRISESMHSDDLVRLMNKYFEAALECIHEPDGTVIDLVGDAIFALWNAPVEQGDHRERACRAALRLRDQLIQFDSTQRSLPLRTRVALHAGQVCVGNIGSHNRFNYTAIGENVNLASRLEGLNKRLGTMVLATREIQRAAEESLVWRPLGHFTFKGVGRAVEVYELVGDLEMAEPSRRWREKFAEALQEFRQRQFESAANIFREVNNLRASGERVKTHDTTLIDGDGPSIFYLEKIEELRAFPPAYEWIGEIELKDK